MWHSSADPTNGIFHPLVLVTFAISITDIQVSIEIFDARPVPLIMAC
jgi:hypothetical protein